MMNTYGNQPLGLNWYRLLSVYSALGSSANSHENSCDIGEELKKLDGKHDVAIQGISAKLDSLIQASGLNLSDDDMTDLKQKIVAKLGEVASRTGANTQPSAPVSCNYEGIVFDDEARQILADVVRAEIKTLRGEAPVPLDTDALSTLVDNKIAQRFTQHGESLADIKSKQEDLTRVVTTSLQSVHDRLYSLTVGVAGGTGETHGDQNPVTVEDMPEGYDEEFYQNDLEAVIKMFRDKDARLYISGGKIGTRAKTFSGYRKTLGTPEAIDRDRLKALLEKIIQEQDTSSLWHSDPMPKLIKESLAKMEKKVPADFLPVEMLRVLHTGLVDQENNTTR